MKISSVFGESLCKINLEQPLPYSWKLVVDNSHKINRKLSQSLAILKEKNSINPTKTDTSNVFFFPQTETSLGLNLDQPTLIQGKL